MKSKNTLLKLAIAFIGITLLILAYIIIVGALQGHVNWVTLLVTLVEGSLLSSLIKMLQDSGK
ncbi:peptidase [Streptococcus macedonicus]|uniref:peptidase n=1 Tax=Streptococcus macedonicus TaxID=59310 RepID=UPI002243B7EA|nr:peptidase [Streptococcus macedonicus]MCW8518275.1 peptidase [Streptococcus macedonicus]MCW8520144.1 peptidase [Streptococcus macedonicus]